MMRLSPALLLAIALTACGPAKSTPPKVLKNVFIILMENRNWDEVKGSPSAPYLNNTLLPMGAHAEAYSNPMDIHPSEPNYLWLEAGTNFGVLTDKDPVVNHQTSTAHLVTQLDAAGVSWKSYQEDIDGMTCPLTSANNYAAKHNPMVFFDDQTDNMNPLSTKCIQHMRPFTELATDLTKGTVARYNFITPNLCNDGHNDCTGKGGDKGANQVGESDAWLAANVPGILASDAYKDGGVLIITWDESTPTGTCPSLSPNCPVGMIVLSPYAKAGYSNTIPYDHSSTLRTFQEIFEVQPFLGGAANATDLKDLFKQFP
jgi:phospholipase C